MCQEKAYDDDLPPMYESKLSFDTEKHEIDDDGNFHAKRNGEDDRFEEMQESFDDGDYREGEDRYNPGVYWNRIPKIGSACNDNYIKLEINKIKINFFK